MKLKTAFGVLSIGCSILLMAAQVRADFGIPISSPEALNTNAATDGLPWDRFPQVTTDGAGKWVAVWQSTVDLDDELGTDNDILVALSTDNGVTWTDPEALNTNADTDSGEDTRPQVTTDGDGTWVAVWSSDDDLGSTIGTDSDILVAVSTNNGATWTAPEALNTNADSDSGDDFGSQVTTDGAGKWVAVWHSDDTLGSTIGTDRDILVARSTDDGDTWTSPAKLNTNAGSDSGADVTPQVATDGAGKWVAVWRSNDTLGGTIGTDTDILVARSTDNGATWTTPEELNTNADSDTGNDTSPQVTTDDGTNWVAVWPSDDDFGETLGTDRDIMVAVSTDDGDTWTDPAALNSNAGSDGQANDFQPQVSTDGLGNWVAVWNSTSSLGGTIGTDQDILVARSTDDGGTWTTPEAFNTNAGSDTWEDAAPQITSDGDNHWVGVWRSTDDLGGTIGTDGDILVARFFVCYANADCDDGNDCTADTCTSNACSNDDEDSGTACDDGLFCTATDECDGSGTCVGSGNPCSAPASRCCEGTDTCIKPIFQCFWPT